MGKEKIDGFRSTFMTSHLTPAVCPIFMEKTYAQAKCKAALLLFVLNLAATDASQLNLLLPVYLNKNILPDGQQDKVRSCGCCAILVHVVLNAFILT